ncbi:uracil-DNA glycosylase [Candidatus Pandoraea novymonadis]|uniref:Type-4 uracil-DNA glycosylase n=1 Tax=Candidatus Pandoraea novymonadis TaxID=1808959 RepID=A0ABX5FEG1_9BURK|nr:uracil-DNA glycosylase [Candidatus Pandoraea novymonadis]PSB92051.1 hypothetical protein BZL35_00277 [Candidatus Pandoraea novymonadis]
MPWPKLILDEFGLWPVWIRRITSTAWDGRTPHELYRDSQLDSLDGKNSDLALQDNSTVIKIPSGQRVFPQETNLIHADTLLQPSQSINIQKQRLDLLDWDDLAEYVVKCRDCVLCEKRTQTVFGAGDRAANWLLVGEAPGQQEDFQGEPFVGQAGKLLDNILRAVNLKRDKNVYVANVLKCRPPNNRNPEPHEVTSCEPYLKRQVSLLKPYLIVVMGRFAAQSILRTKGSIASLRGRLHLYEGIPVIVTYHPAYLLRSPLDKSKAWADWCLARATYESIHKKI